jgi:uncharacterized protein (DUF1499 family)
MVRRYFPTEAKSRLAYASSRLAIFAVIVAALSVVIVRSNLLEIVPALVTFGAALVFAALSVLLGIFGFIVIWRHGLGGLGSAVLGIFLGLALLAYPAYLGVRAYRTPMVNDVTTDPANPPRFDVLARLRPRGTNDYPGGVITERQKKTYPDIAPLDIAAPPKLAFDVTLALINKRKWNVVDARPPQPGRPGTIEAVARTTIMGFREDVAVRVSAAPNNASRVDVRSASRYGLHDFGGNASRVKQLIDDIDDAVLSAPEPKPEPQKKEPPKKNQPAARR